MSAMGYRLLLAAVVCVIGAVSLRAASLAPLSVCEDCDSCGDSVSACSDDSDVLCCAECCKACDGYCTGWYLQADAFILDRNNGSRNRALVLADNTGDTVLTTHDLDFDFQAGPRILIGRRTDIDQAWELSYFGSQSWSGSATATDANNLDIPGPLVAIANDFDNADRMRLTYDSELHNAEFNLVSDRVGWSLLAGFRYLNLDERFNINSLDSDGDVSDYTTRTSNNLFGGQLGARIQRRTSDRMSWEFVSKAGIFGNDAIQHLLLQDNDNTFEILHTTARRATVSFIGDVNLSGVYALNDVWSLRGGYYVMYAAGLALAPDQLDFSNDLTTGTRINTHGDLLLHGTNFGLEAHW
jgi:hypothetical protein